MTEFGTDWQEPQYIAISSDYADIDLLSIKDIRSRLESAQGKSVVLIDASNLSPSLLPSCIENAYLEAAKPASEGSVPELTAAVTIPVESVRDFMAQSSESWADEILDTLKQILGSYCYKCEQLPHDLNTLYVRVDNSHAISIQIVTSIDECAIELELVSVEVLDTMRGEVYSDDPENYSDPTSTLRDFAQCFGLSIDAVVTVLGDEQDEANDNKLILEMLPDTEAAPSVPQETKVGSTVARLADTESPLAASEPSAPEQYSAHRPKLEDLAGLHYPKERLARIVERYQDAAGTAFYQLPVPNIYLQGAAGSGKQTLITALSNDIGGDVMTVPPSEYLVDYSLSAARRLQEQFKNAQFSTDPRVLVFPHFESIAQTRGIQHQAELRKAFVDALQEANLRYPNIIVVCTSESEEGIAGLDRDLLEACRLEPIKVTPPNDSERCEIVAQVLFSGVDLDAINPNHDPNRTLEEYERPPLYEDSIELDEVVRGTEGFSTKRIFDMLEYARELAYRRYRQTRALGPTTREDVRQAIAAFRAH